MTEGTSCPFCFGEIDPRAVKCRHCGEWVKAQPSTVAAPVLTPTRAEPVPESGADLSSGSRIQWEKRPGEWIQAGADASSGDRIEGEESPGEWIAPAGKTPAEQTKESGVRTGRKPWTISEVIFVAVAAAAVLGIALYKISERREHADQARALRHFAAATISSEGNAAPSAAAPSPTPVTPSRDCRDDVVCVFKQENVEIYGVSKCKLAIEGRAKFQARWVDGTARPFAKHYAWGNEFRHVMRLYGDAVQFQNEYGAWQPQTYWCDYKPSTKEVVGVRIWAVPEAPMQLPDYADPRDISVSWSYSGPELADVKLGDQVFIDRRSPDIEVVPIYGAVRGGLFITCVDKIIQVHVGFVDPPAKRSQVKVELAFDDQPSIREDWRGGKTKPWVEPIDIAHTKAFLERLLQHKTVTVRVDQPGDVQSITYNVAGLNERIGALRTACGWDAGTGGGAS